MTDITEVYTKLKKKYDSVEFDVNDGAVVLTETGIKGKCENYQPFAEVSIYGKNCRKEFDGLEELCDFLQGVLKGSVTIVPDDNLSFTVRGMKKKKSERPVKEKPVKERPAKEKAVHESDEDVGGIILSAIHRVLDVILGIVLIIISMILIFASLTLVEHDFPQMMSELMLVPFFTAVFINGVSFFHHGITKFPISSVKACIYGIGVLVLGAAFTLLFFGIGEGGRTDLSIESMLKTSGVLILAGAALVWFGLHRRRSKCEPEDTAVYYAPAKIPPARRSSAGDAPVQPFEEPVFVRRAKPVPKGDAERLMRRIKAMSSRETIKLVFNPYTPTTLTSSKLGGVPYWPYGKPFPTANGYKMVMLAQINCADLPGDFGMPKRGIMQFFLNNAGGYASSGVCKVVFHPTFDPYVTEYDVTKHRIPTSMNTNALPFNGECALGFELTEMTAMPGDIYAEEIFRKEARELDIPLDPEMTFKEFAHDLPAEPPVGSRIGGYAEFARKDPRSLVDASDILLLHLESQESPFTIRWKNGGVGNFFIGIDELDYLDFSHVSFTWND